jgi:DNA-binding NarL/FixJ family response regulator
VTIRVVLADRDPVVLHGLGVMLSAVDDIELVFSVDSGRQAVAEVAAHRPDVLIAEISELPAINEVAGGTALLVFTSSDDSTSVFTAIRAGVRGYILKTAEQPDVVRAILGVAAGEMIYAARLPELLCQERQDPAKGLTGRQRELLDLLVIGLNNAAIARRLQVKPKTVANQVTAILAKLKVPTRAAAISLIQAS